MDLDTLIRDVQSSLGLKDDGKPGPLTWAAIYDRIIGLPNATVATPTILTGGTVDARSEGNIATLHARVQPYARSLVQRAAAVGITLKIISALRSYAEQTALYAQGRSKPGAKVTNANAGYSNHNFGIAFDIGIFSGNSYLDDSPKYKAVAPIAIDLGLTWGGSWKSIDDEPHYELRPAWASEMTESQMLTELRRRKDSGRDYFE
jgi:peptidoglycan L-alanyl-D-glutamate endopeptidase CwlK